MDNFNQQHAMFTEYPDVISISDLSKMLDIGIVLAYRLVKGKEIKARKIGREYKILKADIIDYLQTGGENA